MSRVMANKIQTSVVRRRRVTYLRAKENVLAEVLDAEVVLHLFLQGRQHLRALLRARQRGVCVVAAVGVVHRLAGDVVRRDAASGPARRQERPRSALHAPAAAVPSTAAAAFKASSSSLYGPTAATTTPVPATVVSLPI
eukprot:3633453-Pyramimonas_sp.AAC.1